MINVLIVMLTCGLVLHLEMNSTLDQELEAEIDHLLVLGSLLKSNEITPTLRSRLSKTAELMKTHPKLTVTVTGGKGSEGVLPEAHIMRNSLIEEFGIEANRIQIEDQAHNTFENLVLSKPLLPSKRIGIVTSEFHCIRTAFLAQRIGIDCLMIGAKTEGLKRYKWELREHLAIIKSWFFDRELESAIGSEEDLS